MPIATTLFDVPPIAAIRRRAVVARDGFAAHRAALDRAIDGLTLSGKMMAFFGALLTVALALVLIGSRYGIDRAADRIIGREFAAQSRIFENIRELRYDQMANGAQVLAADYGFRSAVASGDANTIVSAMDTLKRRMAIDDVALVSIEGSVVGLHDRASAREVALLAEAAQHGATRGVVGVAGVAFRVAAVPVRAPETIGWIIFLSRIDDRDLERQASLSAIPLRAHVVPIARLDPAIPIVEPGSATSIERRIGGERTLVQASRVGSFGRSEPRVLVLEYSLSRALDAYTPMLQMLFGSCLLALALAVAGSFYIARKLARPIEALSLAALQVGRGDHVHVAIETADEIGRLASAFNAMVDAIADRGREIAEIELAARAKLETRIREVQQENARLDGIAATQRSATMAEAAGALETGIAPLLATFDVEAKRLFDAAFTMHTSLDGARLRASDAQRSALRAEQMTQGVAASVGDLARASERIAGEARATRGLVERTTGHGAAATTALAQLRGAVDGIGDVTGEIRTISHRTNILALNAAIEAARAGAAGVGFAVVAAEVKDLANQTSRLTDMIASQLDAVKQLTGDADLLTRRVSDALSSTGSATDSIASAARAQSDATGTISIGIADIAAASVIAVEALATIDGAAVESCALADRVTGSAQSVAERVTTLRATLDTFLLRLRAAA